LALVLPSLGSFTSRAYGGNGDFDGNGILDLADFASFQRCFTGSAGGPITGACNPGDHDLDDDIDLDDWAHFLPRFGFRLGVPKVDRLVPAAGTWVVNDQGLTELLVGFDKPVTIPPDAISIWTVGGGALSTFTQAYDDASRVLTMSFGTAVRDDRLTVVVDYSIVDMDGQELDGEIAAPANASLPSGNGVRGGQAVFRINILQGDANRDGVVDGSDLAIIVASNGLCASDPGFDFNADLNGDGCVNAIDANIAITAEGRTLPTTDGIAPEIAARFPGVLANVRTLSLDQATVNFSEPVRSFSITPRSLLVVRPDGALQIAASVVLNAANDNATFTFEPSLAMHGDYQITLSNAIADPSGELLSPNADSNWAATIDPSPALVASTSPADGEDGVAVTRETIIRFTHPMAAANIPLDAIVAEFGGEVLPARTQVAADNRAVTLFYDAPLPASARIRVTVDGNAMFDDLGNAIDADADGVPGGVATIDFDTLTLTTLPGTAVCGRVFASRLTDAGMNEPLAGVLVTVDGAEDELFCVTDSMGNFRLEPAPVGRFFVHIDGRAATNSSTPPGAYYPFVGEPFESVAGTVVNLPNIFLPLVAPETLQAVSQVEDTEITFPPSVLVDSPELAGVNLMVPADSLFADDGTRGGMVGIAPVPPDRIPGQLPPGLNFPLVITVQTDGATNFDIPVPICFPNLPDPGTGELLPPGEASALFSFNHDTGRWNLIGPMTVTSDGLNTCTDPGVGIIAPGWHATKPRWTLERWLGRIRGRNRCRICPPPGPGGTPGVRG